MKVVKVPCTCEKGAVLTLSGKEVHDLKVIATAIFAQPDVLKQADGIMPRVGENSRTWDVYGLLNQIKEL